VTRRSLNGLHAHQLHLHARCRRRLRRHRPSLCRRPRRLRVEPISPSVPHHPHATHSAQRHGTRHRHSVPCSWAILHPRPPADSAARPCKPHGAPVRNAAPVGLTEGWGGACGTQTKQELRNSWAEKDGEHSWLEEVESEAALKWVVEQNESAVAALGDPKGTPLYDRVLSILDSKEKIPL
jgi:hypothetical protein